jgi:hypothetical protein
MDELNSKDIEFLKRLNRKPHLKARMEALLNVAEAAVESGEMTADEVEIQLREQVMNLGQDTLQSWAISKEKTMADQIAGTSGVKRHGKKKSIGTQHSEE